MRPADGEVKAEMRSDTLQGKGTHHACQGTKLKIYLVCKFDGDMTGSSQTVNAKGKM